MSGDTGSSGDRRIEKHSHVLRRDAAAGAAFGFVHLPPLDGGDVHAAKRCDLRQAAEAADH
ncbi:hypothetical protein ACLBXM_17835 [Xanthobacteraceae bacterium A53D]